MLVSFLQIAISQLVYVPDPIPGTDSSTKLSAAARMCSDFNTDQCGRKRVDVAPDSLNGPGGTVSTGTVVPNQVSFKAPLLTINFRCLIFF